MDRPTMRTSTTRSTGFTLLEILLVVTILALLIGVIGSTLSGGLRVWEVARHFGTREAEIIAGLEVVEKDLANTFRFQVIPFSGHADSVSFPALVTSARNPDNGQFMRPGMVNYQFNTRERVLVRAEALWAPGESEPTQRFETLLRNIESFEFAYADASALMTPSESQWLSTWESTTNLPALVRVRVVFSEESGPAPVELVRTVLIPVAMMAVEHGRYR